MSNRAKQEERQVHDIITAANESRSVGELMGNATLKLSRRTLQRRIDALVNGRALQPQGEGRGRRYLAISPSSSPREYPPHILAEPSSPYGTYKNPEEPRKKTLLNDVGDEWLSPEAKEIRALIDRPIFERDYVGYDVTFLAAYQPNVTFYLPEETRAKLARVGRSGEENLPAGTYLRHVLDRLIIDLAWNSSRLEGNTYSLLETERLLNLGEGITGKKTNETQMIVNHKAAIELLSEQADEIGFNRYSIFSLHALLSENLLMDNEACGRLRLRGVGISGSVYSPTGVPQTIEECFDGILIKAEAIKDPFEAAFFIMVHLPYLQPFEDVNKRTSRLAANIPLLKHNFCPLSFVEVEAEHYLKGLLGVYELNRIEYLRDVFVRAYVRSAQRYPSVRDSLGEPDPFRLRYRGVIRDIVQGIVLNDVPREEELAWLRAKLSVELSPAEMVEMREVVDRELLGLHEGNIARFRLRPSDFQKWSGKETRRVRD
ncbi:Fic family protein [Akkermansiaceae bacterium]|nr:Fic family protein [Akkermansiaceae bacterium]MDB4525562.1 Fic family protein [Akkermansiaceae bacterium]MDB4547492.1 Fic family protein [Akkermansiaceae bacterium]